MIFLFCFLTLATPSVTEINSYKSTDKEIRRLIIPAQWNHPEALRLWLSLHYPGKVSDAQFQRLYDLHREEMLGEIPLTHDFKPFSPEILRQMNESLITPPGVREVNPLIVTKPAWGTIRGANAQFGAEVDSILKLNPEFQAWIDAEIEECLYLPADKLALSCYLIVRRREGQRNADEVFQYGENPRIASEERIVKILYNAIGRFVWICVFEPEQTYKLKIRFAEAYLLLRYFQPIDYGRLINNSL